ncbi:hypothetical protein BDV12DRAFT_205829 [Aspergillus spectabilis]
MDSSKQALEDGNVNKNLELQPTEGPISNADHDELTLSGWRLKLLTIGLCICCFLSALDAIIVTTSLTAVARDLQAFDESSWVVSSYLTCYFSFMIIWAKVSDLIGRKLMLVIAIVLFLGFSGGCGGARTSLELIVFRAFQGIGGAGIFSLVPIVVAEMVPPSRYGPYNVAISLTIALSYLLGPLLGGAISDNTTWRWIFYINIPLGAAGLLLIYATLPAAFPDVSNPAALWFSPRSIGDVARKVDYLGFFLILAASVFLIVAIEEAGIAFSWDSAIVIVFLTMAIALFGAFLAWEWYLYWSSSTREPVFPWEFTKNRVLMGTSLTALLSGVPYTALVLELPERFQTLNNMSGLDSGVRILPFTVSLGLGAGLAGGLTASGRMPPFLVFSISAVLQIISLGLLYSVSPDTALPARLFGYQILSGLGVGASLNTAMSIVPSLVASKDLSVAMGTITQLRILGGALGVSICTNILNSILDKSGDQVPAGVMERIRQDISVIQTLPVSEQALVRAAFADGYRRQLLMVLGFSGVQVLALVLLWERPLRRL